jgi:hypothetical protein
MDTGYVVLDLDTGNALRGFTSEAAALIAVREAAEQYGREAVDSWGLALVTERGTVNLGEGQDLLDRAQNGESAQHPVRDTA